MASTSRGLRGLLLLATSATLLTLVALAVVGEWAVRRRERTRTSVPGTMSKLFYQHTRLMHAMERGSEYYGWASIGPEGFRGSRSVVVSRPDSVFRIIAAGGSTTFDGNTSGDSSAWPARLEQILDSLGAPVDFEVLNAGVPGFQVFDDLVRFELELHRFEPDLIILYQGHNDLFNTLARAGRAPAEFERRPGELPTVLPWERWLERNSLLYHKLSSRLQAIQFRRSGTKQRTRATPHRFASVLEDGAGNFARNLRFYVAVAQAAGIDVIIPQVVYARPTGSPTSDSLVKERWGRAVPFAPYDVVRQGYARYDSVASAVAAGTGARYVPSIDSTLWKLDGYAYGDPIHFNDEGAWRLAGHLARTILPVVAEKRQDEPHGARHASDDRIAARPEAK